MRIGVAYFGPQSEAENAMQIIEDFVNDDPELFQIVSEGKKDHATFMDWHGPDTDPGGISNFLASRLIQTENLDTDDARAKTAEALASSGKGAFHLTAGKGVMDADPDATSVLPAWRKTVLHYIVGTMREGTIP